MQEVRPLPANANQLYMPRLQLAMGVVKHWLEGVIIARGIARSVVVNATCDWRLIDDVFFVASR